MLGSISLVDILFLVTIVLLVFNGLRNGFIFSVVSFFGLFVAGVVVWLFGPQFTNLLAANHLPATPLIAYIVLFFGTVLIIHILATIVRGTIKKLPLIGAGDTLLGGVVGFVEAWLLWVVLLWILQGFLQDVSQVQKLGVDPAMFQSWQQFYDQAVSHSLFASVNGFIIKTIPLIPVPK